MKTNFHHIKATLLATAVAFSLTACEDFFNEKPYGQLTTEGFFSNKEDLAAFSQRTLLCGSYLTSPE